MTVFLGMLPEGIEDVGKGRRTAEAVRGIEETLEGIEGIVIGVEEILEMKAEIEDTGK